MLVRRDVSPSSFMSPRIAIFVGHPPHKAHRAPHVLRARLLLYVSSIICESFTPSNTCNRPANGSNFAIAPAITSVPPPTYPPRSPLPARSSPPADRHNSLLYQIPHQKLLYFYFLPYNSTISNTRGSVLRRPYQHRSQHSPR